MSIKKQLEDSLIEAMKSKDEIKKKIIRLALSSITIAEKEKGNELDDTSVISILQKEIKIRKDSIDEAQQASRPELIEGLKNEIKLISTFLPEQMSESETRQVVQRVISEIGASSMADMGTVMKTSLPLIEGKAPNSLVSKIVREELSK